MTLPRATAIVLAVSATTVGLSAQQTPRRNSAWRDIQGFNIVLVVGESQRSGTSTDDVPTGARRALNDMREFLPYKYYRVLDSQWTSCCAPDAVRVGSAIAGRLQGVTAGAGPGGSTVLVPRHYAFSLSVSESTEASRIPVRFSLRSEDGGGGRGSAQAARTTTADRTLEGRANDIRGEMEQLSIQIQSTRRQVEAGVVSPSVLQQLEARQAQYERRLAETMNAINAVVVSGSGSSGRPIIDSSFMMEAGETIVVGTSRLGGDKALIALVTAVRRSTSSR